MEFQGGRRWWGVCGYNEFRSAAEFNPAELKIFTDEKIGSLEKAYGKENSLDKDKENGKTIACR